MKIENLTNKLYLGDCNNIMSNFPDNSIDLIITSPPYDNLRDYKGYTFNFKEIAVKIYKILKNGGILVWIIGDETKNFCESLTSFKQAIFFVEKCGFNLLDTMIYYKYNYKPITILTKRYDNRFEYMFIFSKGKPKTFNPIQRKRVRNKKEKKAFRLKNGSFKRKVVNVTKKTKKSSNVWMYALGGNKFNHPAVFPEKLAKEHILSWSNENDIVLDPFTGSGTTCYMAQKLNRKYIGIEINEEYIKIASIRLDRAKIIKNKNIKKQKNKNIIKPKCDKPNIKCNYRSFNKKYCLRKKSCDK